MKLHGLLGLCIAALAGSGAVWSQAPSPPTGDGLVPIRSWNLDEIYLRPNVDLASYRKVVIDPVQVVFRKDWNKDFVDPHAATGRITQDDVRRIADETASGLQSALSDAFKARGYEIAAAPGPGVLRLSPSVTNLYVNAAGETATWGTTKSFTKDAGEATFVLEIRDAGTGMLLGHVVDHRTARETKGTQRSDLIRSGRVSNNFWFDEMSRRWASACVKEFEASRKS
ncbi:MAG TPA: DUF3313 family protein [Burkholderiales bacterium]|nr:DUF3313 family protein [Burkholderiales bacterium]